MGLCALMTDSDIFTYQSLTAAQQVDEEPTALRLTPHSLVWQDVSFPDHTLTLVRDISTGDPDPSFHDNYASLSSSLSIVSAIPVLRPPKNLLPLVFLDRNLRNMSVLGPGLVLHVNR